MSQFDLSKFSSGKFWLTIIAGTVFAWASYSGKLFFGEISMIVTMVFVAYFNKDKNGGKPV